jgi:tyrosyl-tRNA synthetase
VLDLFVRAGLCGSKGEARRLVQQGGARINNEKIDDVEAVIGTEWADADGAMLLRAGKKRYYKFDVT